MPKWKRGYTIYPLFYYIINFLFCQVIKAVRNYGKKERVIESSKIQRKNRKKEVGWGSALRKRKRAADLQFVSYLCNCPHKIKGALLHLFSLLYNFYTYTVGVILITKTRHIFFEKLFCLFNSLIFWCSLNRITFLICISNPYLVFIYRGFGR